MSVRFISISRLIMKDSQPADEVEANVSKYIKADNERFSTIRVLRHRRL